MALNIGICCRCGRRSPLVMLPLALALSLALTSNNSLKAGVIKKKEKGRSLT